MASAADTVGAGTRCEGFAFPAQPHGSFIHQTVDRRMDRRHGVSPAIPRSYRARHLAWANRRNWRSHREECECRVTGAVCHGLRRLPRDRPHVIGSGLGGARQPAGGVLLCWLDPRPIAPGCCRSNPAKFALSASAAVAPPRIMLIMSRHRFASSKFKARAASSILFLRVSIVSGISAKRMTR